MTNARKILGEVEGLRAQQNKASDEIGALIKAKQDPKPVIASMKDISNKAAELEKVLSVKEEELNNILMTIPNIPQPSVPVGTPDKAQIVRSWGTPRQFDFKPLDAYRNMPESGYCRFRPRDQDHRF